MDWRMEETNSAVDILVTQSRKLGKVDAKHDAPLFIYNRAEDSMKQAKFNLTRKINRWIMLATKRRILLKEYRELILKIFEFMEHDAVIRAHATDILSLRDRFQGLHLQSGMLEEEEDGSNTNR